MRDITPLHDNVLGIMIEPIGAERVANGIIITETNLGEGTIRPRWFSITHVGPEQIDVIPGDYVLMPHGRWSRGLDIEGTRREEDKLFRLDINDMLGVSKENPL